MLSFATYINIKKTTKKTCGHMYYYIVGMDGYSMSSSVDYMCSVMCFLCPFETFSSTVLFTKTFEIEKKRTKNSRQAS